MFRPSRALCMQVLRFAVVGGGVMLTFVGLNAFFGQWFSDQGAFLASYPPAVALHFLLNKWWTFGAGRGKGTGRQLRDYLVMVAATFILQWLVFSILNAFTDGPAWLLAGVANAFQMGVTFIVMQRRVFAKPATL